MSVAPASTVHRLESWRDDVDVSLSCAACDRPITVGDQYRIPRGSLLVLCLGCSLEPLVSVPAGAQPSPVRRVKRVVRRASRAAPRPSTAPTPIACVHCSTVFTPIREPGRAGPPARYCSDDCRAEIQRIRVRARWRQQHPVSIQRRAPVVPCAVCKKPFSAYSFGGKRGRRRTCSTTCRDASGWPGWRKDRSALVALLSPDRPILGTEIATALGLDPKAVRKTLARLIARGEPILRLPPPSYGYVLRRAE